MDENNQMNGQQAAPDQQYDGQQYQQPYGAQGMPNQQMYGQYGGQYQQPYGAQGMPNQQMNGQYGGQYQQPYGAQGMPNQQMYGGQAAPQRANNSGNIVGEVVEGITGLITTPHDTMQKLVSNANIAVGGILIALQAVIAFILVFFSFLILGTRSMGISAIGCAFYAFFFVLIIDIIAAGMLTLMGSTILKGNLTFGKSVNAVGVFAIFQIVANILAVIFILIGGLADVHFFISVGYILFVGITLLALVFGITAASMACELDGNVKLYTIGVALILTVLLGVAVDNIGEKLFEEQNVSAYKIYSMMEGSDTVKEYDKNMKDYYEDYYEDDYSSYGKFLKEYYD